ncbi:c-di-GMP-binding flagellar brake protein YcgR [Desulfobaculum xiamenense]|uniref:C-di-GMP-binding flagellar brake protein YcgR n=1 Tax=Desulfobaculum xiamenense TaxID=995050 RepID=A0A846QPW7_9BACT|nr:hypothetical protein [Desulfobaculum xiamenense]NJB66739.1 c-di-GMP-binding flagellar brake protein YcgR [Desulfobaculum xiamenense]
MTTGFTIDTPLPAFEALRGTIDRSFLDSVQKNFGSWGITSESITIVLVTLSAAFIVTGGAILFNHYVLKPRRDTKPPSWITDQASIMSLFDAIMAQRSKVEMRFAGGAVDNTRRSTACSLEHVKDGLLDLEISGFVKAHQGWLNRDVQCFFRVTTPGRKDHANFYTFTSRIKGIRKISQDVTHIAVPVPEHIELSQKRLSLRIEPPLQFSLGLALWPEKLRRDGSPEPLLRKWGRPPVFYSRQMNDTPLRIVNVSSGGMRLELTPDSVKETGFGFEIGERYVLMAQFFDPDRDAKLNLWTMCRIQNRYEDFESRRLEIGVQFSEIGQLVKDDGGKIIWKKVPADGIARLGNWVARRHLDLYREKGLT